MRNYARKDPKYSEQKQSELFTYEERVGAERD